MDGYEVFDGKYAKKFGDCQCVTPGRITLSTSFIMLSNVSPCSGALFGKAARIWPGLACDRTGNDSMRA